MTDRMSQRMKNDLDNYITGHYGEDQFANQEPVWIIRGNPAQVWSEFWEDWYTDFQYWNETEKCWYSDYECATTVRFNELNDWVLPPDCAFEEVL